MPDFEPVLLARVGKPNSQSLASYHTDGGYRALAKAVNEMTPAQVVDVVKASNLRGRGGAGFPCGLKWSFLPKDHPGPIYMCINADESEPCTFNNRILMEEDPHQVLQGIMISCYATRATTAYVYIRYEYGRAYREMQKAIDELYQTHLLGKNILGKQGFNLDIYMHRGAGAYICGEETALFNSIEGYRGEPRNKPPFPTQSGLFHQPTVVNNVETLINIPEIILGGGAAYARIGTEHSAGYRLFCLSGHVVRPGVYEVPFGATLRNLIDLAGGVGGNGKLQGVLLGGAAGVFVSPDKLDTPLTFEGTRAIGATLGSGVIMLFDDSIDMKQILLRIAAFFRDETCGQCVPCRVGAVRQEEALERLINRKPLGSVAGEIQTLREMAQAMRDASICGLGQTASSALLSAIGQWSLFS